MCESALMALEKPCISWVPRHLAMLTTWGSCRINQDNRAFFGAPQSWLMPKLVISILMDWCTYGLIQATISAMHPSERNCTIHESQHLMMSYAQTGYDWTCFIETFTFNISKALKKENGETRAPQSSNAPQTKTCLRIGCLFILEVCVKLFRISGKGLVTNYLPFYLSKNHS